MKIGVQVSCDLKNRTGTEEYTYQLLRHLPMVDDYKNHQFFILAPYHPSEARIGSGYIPKVLKWPFRKGWTQIRLSLEMLKNPPDILFVPSHTFPLIHPKKIIVAIQGLEFERLPKMYSLFRRKILRFLTKRNAKKAEKIIVPSQSTKNDLIKFYKINPEKIHVVYHGINRERQGDKVTEDIKEIRRPYILYLGSGHKRKNIRGLIETFRILKTKYLIPHQLMLAGPQISNQIPNPNFQKDIIFKNYVNEEEKWQLLKNAEVFVFPSFCEGFGFPVLEAQVVGVPVVVSNVSSLPEILSNSALLVNPHKPEEIASAIYKIISSPNLKKLLIKKGQENVKRFSWEKCAKETLEIISKS